MGRSRPVSGRVRSNRVLVVNALALLVAVPALVQSVSFGAGSNLLADSHALMGDAAVSLSASVPANPYNTLASQLADEKSQLDERARDLAAQQAAASSHNALEHDLTVASFCMSIVLLLLVGLNFYLDVRRRRGQSPGYLERKFLVDLRL